MINKQLISDKLTALKSYYDELNGILSSGIDDIMSDNLKLRSLERLFQLIVDSAIDINSHIISQSDFQAPDDYQSTFITLAENKLLPMDFALRIAPSVGLRNQIVHKYGRVDTKRMIEDISKNISDYLEYSKMINGL